MALPPLPAGFELEQPEVAAPPAGAPPLPEGFQVEAPSAAPADPFGGVAPARDTKSLRAGMDALAKRKVAPDVMREYVKASGFDLPEDQASEYQRYLKTPNAQIEFSVPEPDEGAGNLEAAWSGMKSGALMGLDDEWQAGWGVAGNYLGRVLGLNESDMGIADTYAAIRDQNRAVKDRAYETNHLAYGAGFLPGAIFSAPVTALRGAQAATLPGRLGQAALGGAEAGAISGFGNAEGDFGEQALSTMGGAALGAPAGVASYPIAAAVSNIAGRVAGRAAPRSREETSGLDMLDWRAPQDINAMTGRMDEMIEAGVPPRLVDVVDESGRGVVRDSASKMTPAREEVARHADDVYVSAQDRIAEQANRHISDAPMTARQLERQMRGDRALGGDDEAGVIMGAEMEPLRGRPIQIDDQMKMVLSTREGQAALRAAEGLMTDPAEREAARGLLSAARRYAHGPLDPEDVWRQEVPEWDMLPEAIKAAYRAQRPDVVPQGDAFEGMTMSLDTVDKFARAMRGRAMKTPGLERVARDFSNTVRGAAREQVPEYEQALADYAARQGVADAAGATGRFEGRGFMTERPDTYARQVEMASAEPPPPNTLDVEPDAPPPPAGPSELDALRMRARDDIVDVATANAGQNAPAVARTLSRGSGQAARNEALLGPEGARALEQSMGQEVRRVDNTRFIDSRSGSKTQSASRDAVVDGFADALGNVASAGNPKFAIAREAARWLRKGGIRDIDAERLARLSISENEADVRQAINYLERRGMERSRATRFVHAMGEHVAARPATAAPEQDRPKPNSVRALMRGQ